MVPFLISYHKYTCRHFSRYAILANQGAKTASQCVLRILCTCTQLNITTVSKELYRYHAHTHIHIASIDVVIVACVVLCIQLHTGVLRKRVKLVTVHDQSLAVVLQHSQLCDSSSRDLRLCPVGQLQTLQILHVGPGYSVQQATMKVMYTSSWPVTIAYIRNATGQVSCSLGWGWSFIVR